MRDLFPRPIDSNHLFWRGLLMRSPRPVRLRYAPGSDLDQRAADFDWPTFRAFRARKPPNADSKPSRHKERTITARCKAIFHLCLRWSVNSRAARLILTRYRWWQASFCMQVEQQGIDLVVDLFDSSNQKIADADSPNDNWGAEPIVLLANSSGNYRIDIRSPNKTALTGRYKIKIIASRKATATDPAHVAAERAFNQGRTLRAQQTVAARRSAIEKYEQALPFFRDSGDRIVRPLHFFQLASPTLS